MAVSHIVRYLCGSSASCFSTGVTCMKLAASLVIVINATNLGYYRRRPSLKHINGLCSTVSR